MIETIIGVILLLLVITIAFAIVGVYNKMVRYENEIDNSWAQIEVQLQRRGELIPNLVDTVKGYAKHEKETLDNVTKARAGLMQAQNPAAKMAAEGMLEQALGKLFAVAEAYPELKANQNFLQLQDELTHTENKIGYARQAYNDSVLAFNNLVEVFPNNVIAGMFNKTERQMLEAPAAARTVPKVEF